jgi:hypothetical protein
MIKASCPAIRIRYRQCTLTTLRGSCPPWWDLNRVGLRHLTTTVADRSLTMARSHIEKTELSKRLDGKNLDALRLRGPFSENTTHSCSSSVCQTPACRQASPARRCTVTVSTSSYLACACLRGVRRDAGAFATQQSCRVMPGASIRYIKH